MGGGDIKMVAMVGAFVGWKGVLLTIFAGALFGSLVYVPLLVLGKRKRHVPFGVFLAMGAAVAPRNRRYQPQIAGPNTKATAAPMARNTPNGTRRRRSPTTSRRTHPGLPNRPPAKTHN